MRVECMSIVCIRAGSHAFAGPGTMRGPPSRRRCCADGSRATAYSDPRVTLFQAFVTAITSMIAPTSSAEKWALSSSRASTSRPRG